MALSNAERQRRWRERRNALAKAQERVGGARNAIVEQFADGSWHKLDTIANAIDGDPELVAETLAEMMEALPVKVERKQVGASWSYRLLRAERHVSTAELATKLGPLIEGLITEGKKDLATFSPNTVRRFAHLLKQQLDEWTIR